MSSQRDEARWVGELLCSVVSISLTLFIWCATGVGRQMVGRYRHDCDRPGMTATAVLLVMALVLAMMPALSAARYRLVHLLRRCPRQRWAVRRASLSYRAGELTTVESGLALGGSHDTTAEQ